MERVDISFVLLLTLVITSFTLAASTDPHSPNFRTQSAKTVIKGEARAKGETRIVYPYAPPSGVQNKKTGKDDDSDKMINGLNGALNYGAPPQGYFGYPFPGGFFGFPRGFFGFPRGIFGFPLGFRGGFPGGYGGFPGGDGGYPGGYGGYPGGYGGNPGDYGGGPGNKPGGGGGYPGYGGKAEVKGKKVNPHD